MIFPEGELVKMTIEAFEDSEFSVSVPDGIIEVLINPESFKESYTISYKEGQPTETTGIDQKFEAIKPGEFSEKLLLDSTGLFATLEPSLSAFADQLKGLVPSGFMDVNEDLDVGISEEVDHLKTILFRKNGTTHEPNCVRFEWAALIVDCKIKKVDIDYKLFNNQGYPIRAEVNLTCINTISDVLRKAEENLSSPDLTHMRVVKEGDTLPLMTYKIYGDSKYYLEVARVNNILNFRDLTPGYEIFFPPLDKTQTA